MRGERLGCNPHLNLVNDHGLVTEVDQGLGTAERQRAKACGRCEKIIKTNSIRSRVRVDIKCLFLLTSAKATDENQSLHCELICEGKEGGRLQCFVCFCSKTEVSNS